MTGRPSPPSSPAAPTTPVLLDVEAIIDPAVAAVALDPVRSRILATLVEPGSATTVAGAIGETRQKVNYHLRMLEAHGLVRLVEERPRRGLTERVVVASARSYVVSPAALGPSAASAAAAPGPGAGPAAGPDRQSSGYLLAVAARTLEEVADLARRAARARKPLPTLTIDTEIRFASAADRAAFTAELAAAVTTLAARYHDESTPGGRRHRLVVAAHPRPASPDLKPDPESDLESDPKPDSRGGARP